MTQPAPMTATQFRHEIDKERAAWDAVLAEVPADRFTEPGATGDWSVKDVIAHNVWHEREMVGVLRARALVGSELWNVDNETRNDAIYAKVRDIPLDEVLAEATAVYAELRALLDGITDADLNDPDAIRDMVPGFTLLPIAADNTYLHWRAHRLDLRAWLDTTSG